jgi:hypothetical protein
MTESNPLRFASLRMAGVEVALHEMARDAYGAWSALSRMLAVGDLPPDMLAAMFTVRPMIAVQNGTALRVVGGFAAFRIWCQLDAIRHRPTRANVLFVDDDPAVVAGLTEAELLFGISECTDRNVASALLDYAQQLSPDARALVLGSGRVTKGRVAKLAGQDRRHLKRTKGLVAPDDSDILQQVIAKL